jgi:hypothetical protein
VNLHDSFLDPFLRLNQGLKDSHDSSSPEPISFKIPGLKKVIGGAVQQSKAAIDTPAAAAPQQKVSPPITQFRATRPLLAFLCHT